MRERTIQNVEDFETVTMVLRAMDQSCNSWFPNEMTLMSQECQYFAQTESLVSAGVQWKARWSSFLKVVLTFITNFVYLMLCALLGQGTGLRCSSVGSLVVLRFVTF